MLRSVQGWDRGGPFQRRRTDSWGASSKGKGVKAGATCATGAGGCVSGSVLYPSRVNAARNIPVRDWLIDLVLTPPNWRRHSSERGAHVDIPVGLEIQAGRRSARGHPTDGGRSRGGAVAPDAAGRDR